jgi:hypothetical protein
MQRLSPLGVANALLGIYAAVPVALLVAFYGFVVRARIELGVWPKPMTPDPKEMAIASDMDVVFWAFVLAVCCALPWLLTAYLRVRLAPERRHSKPLLLLSVPWLCALALWFIDPGRFVEWFLD